MWYVAQVNSGQEAAARDMCKQMVDPEILLDCFLPEYETMRKVKGEWRSIRCLLFSGYLFMVSDSVLDLVVALRSVPTNVKLLGQGNGEGDILPLADWEKDWLLTFADETHCIRMSEAIIEGDAITVTRGPMLGHEAIIKKVHRHKRRALIEVSMFGRATTATIGLEVIRKSV